MRLPVAEETIDDSVLEFRKAESWLFNSHIEDLNSYVRSFCAGEHYSMFDASVHIIEQQTSRIGWDDGSGTETYIHLRFRVDGFEATGYNRVWFNYQWYDDEDEKCEQKDSCISWESVEGQLEPYEYYSAHYFGDFINRDYIIGAYWFLFAQSIFPVIGLPFGMMVTAALNIYMDYEVIYHFVVASFAVGGWYDPEQNDIYSYFNWLVESVFYWSVGTHLVTYAMLLNSLLPLIGPVFNALIVALSYFIIF